jgi:hypothetical protein
MITQKELRAQFLYDKKTGVFTRIKSGKSCHTKNGSGYVVIRVNGSLHLSHRLAFLYVTGAQPKEHIDHINGIRADNSFSNLREASPIENSRNKRRYKTNKSGIHGVHWVGRDRVWRSRIAVNGIKTHLADKADFFEACCIRKSAELRFSYHKNHGR